LKAEAWEIVVLTPEVGELGEVDCDFEESEGPGVRGGLGNEL